MKLLKGTYGTFSSSSTPFESVNRHKGSASRRHNIEGRVPDLFRKG